MAVMMPPAGRARAQPPPAEPLDAHVVDVASYPSVLIDVVVPWQFATAEIDPAMIELEDASIESVARVDAVTNVVGLVIDDGPTVPTEVVYSAQAASIELVRNLGDGTAIALSTPSGMQTTPTTDRGASIARIAGITAGAPDVVPLHRLVLDAAERLADTAWPERHLVLVLGRPINERPTLLALADIAAEADMRLHVIADPGIDTGDAANLADNTGGVASGGQAMLAEVDQVTSAIANRVRVRATVTAPGPRELVLTVDGARFATEIDVPTSPMTPTSTPTGTAATPTGTAATPTGTAATQAAPAPATDVTAAPIVRAAAPATGPDRAGSALWIAVVPVVAVLSALGWWLWSSARRRARRRPPAPAPRTRHATPVIQPVGSRPQARVAARSAKPATENDVVTPDDPVDTSVAGGAPAGERRRPAGRPRRATPHRRPPTDAPPPAEPLPEEPADPADWLVVGRLRLSRSAGEVFSGSRRISLTSTEFAVLELLMTRGGHGVTQDAIRAAASTNGNGGEPLDLDDILAELRRKTGLRGRGRGVRSERTLVYFFRE